MRRILLFLVLVLSMLPWAAQGDDLCISTYAGNGEDHFSGDGGPALKASISDFLWGVTVDAAGNVYFVDGLFRVRKIDSSGVISTVVGNGEEGFNGDEIPATQASIDDPRQIAFDSAGRMYLTDDENHRIRMVDTAGIIHTVVGDGLLGFAGDGGLATAARLRFPHGVALDTADNLYIADTYNQVVRKVNAVDGKISTIAGTPSIQGDSGDGLSATAATLDLPNSLAVDVAGTVYINDSGNNRIRKIATDGVISTYAGDGTPGFGGDGGLAVNAQLDGVNHISLDSAGNLYLADRYNQRIRKVDLASGKITTVAGTGSDVYSGDGGPALLAGLAAPEGVGVNAAGDLFIADYSHIRKVDAGTGNISNFAGWENGALAVEASVNSPSGTFFDEDENAYIVDTYNHRIRKVEHATGLISTYAGNGMPGDLGDGGPATDANFSYPSAAIRDADGNVFVADTLNHKVRRIDGVSGVIETYAGNGTPGSFGDGASALSANLDAPSGLALDLLGNLYIACTNSHSIRKVDKVSGNISKVVGTSYGGFNGDGPDGAHAALNSPTGLAMEDDGDLFIADTGNNRIRRFNISSGFIATVAGNGLIGSSGNGGLAVHARLKNPQGIAVGEADESLYIADTGNNQIRKVAPDGRIELLAGTGTDDYSGDGGPAVLATLSAPQAVNLDEDGEVWISDSLNDRVRRLKPCPAVPTPVVSATGAEIYHNLFYPERGERVVLVYQLSAPVDVAIKVFDVKGREIRTVVDLRQVPRGIYRSSWDGRDAGGAFVASGIYLVHFRLGDTRVLKKAVAVR
ncbi:MAG: FlgD immunoglobulin-like domain containing protein [candidate division FCPU426 bacterium]